MFCNCMKGSKLRFTYLDKKTIISRLWNCLASTKNRWPEYNCLVKSASMDKSMISKSIWSISILWNGIKIVLSDLLLSKSIHCVFHEMLQGISKLWNNISTPYIPQQMCSAIGRGAQRLRFTYLVDKILVSRLWNSLASTKNMTTIKLLSKICFCGQINDIKIYLVNFKTLKWHHKLFWVIFYCLKVFIVYFIKCFKAFLSFETIFQHHT